MFKKYFPAIDSQETAKEMSKQGALGVLIFTGMNLFGLIFMYLAGTSPVDGSEATLTDIQDQLIGTAVLIPILLFMAWRIFKGKGWLASTLALLWFIAEIAMKILGGTTNIGWMIAYIAIVGMMVNGFRACWFQRNWSKDSADEAV